MSGQRNRLLSRNNQRRLVKLKILALDIENLPELSYHFGRKNLFIPPENTLKEGTILCCAAQWYGTKRIDFKWYDETNPLEFIDWMWNLLDDADVVLGFNSKKFDCRKLNALFVEHGYAPPSPYQHLDLYKVCNKQFGWTSHRLKYILKKLGLSPKLEDNSNMSLWMGCAAGDSKCMDRMRKYNIQDVRSTVELYEYLLPWIDSHPNWGQYIMDDDPICPTCGSKHVTKHKVRRTKTMTYQQYQCQDCGSYSRGRKALPTSEGLLSQ